MLHELSAGEASLVMLFPHLAGLDLVHVEDPGDGVRITARTRTAPLACRGAGWSRRGCMTGTGVPG